MRINLITGGAGFVGSNLAIEFKKNNQDIRVVTLDNLQRRGSELNIQRYDGIGDLLYQTRLRLKRYLTQNIYSRKGWNS
jgi:nucleoside-diphosphate-sugar epimerase